MFILFLVVFVNLVGFGIIIPLLPFYAEYYDASPDQVTLLMALYSITQLITTPIWGGLSDKYGRKPMILISLAGTVIAYIGIASAPNLTFLYVIRAWGGIMAGSISCAFASMADITTTENRTKGMGLLGAAFGLGFILGPAIGGLLAGGDLADTNYSLPSYAAAVFSGLSFLIALFVLDESKPKSVRKQKLLETTNQYLKKIELYASHPNIRNTLLLTFVAILVFAALESTFAMWTERTFGWGVEQNGYLFAYSGLLSVFVQGVLVGPMSKKWGLLNLVKQGYCGLFIGLIMLPFADTIWFLLLAMAIVTYGFSLVSPVLSSQLSLDVSPEDQGSMMGIGRSVSTLARALGPIGGGYIFVFFGKDWPFFFGALLILIVFLWRLTNVIWQKK